ncbi:unnamed protein product [Clonostachys rosea]|uniref:F-box domain-containing protein n=1 Tax=Bionectria ochroleuca TaxID=29856 RepID=A0ABY6UVI3_BIOOC|nr:unnamed protein product [Clonostachys rosea]
MAQFSDFPNEIIDHILSFVPRCDLPNICLVNKSLQVSADPLLYSTILLDWHFFHIPPIIPLLRTLLQRPELFAYVKTVSLHGEPFPSRPETPLLDMTNIALDDFIAAIERTQAPFTDYWVRKVRLGGTCIEALAGLLIANLSKTTRLAINHNFINGRHLIQKVLQAKIFGPCQMPPFSNLKDIRYYQNRDPSFARYNVIFDDAISLFYLPTVTHISVSFWNPEVFQWPAGEPHLDHLTSLDIQWLCDAFVAKILSLTRNLKSLFWTWHFENDPDDPWDSSTIDFDNIVAVLSHVKESLRFRLDVGPEEFEDWDELEFTVLGSFSGLRDFDRITHLDVPLTSLPGSGPKPLPLEQYVPDSVEILSLPDVAFCEGRVTEDWSGFGADDIVSVIQPLAETYPTTLPRLRCINVFDTKTGSFKRDANLDARLKEISSGFDVQLLPYELPGPRFYFGEG